MFRPLNKAQTFSQVEKRILDLWKKEKTFEASLKANQQSKDYVFYDGPPFATGLPHYGHLLAGTIKDIIPRYWSMKGNSVERRFGWDCHGLPIESLIQNELKLDGVAEIQEYGVENFNEACRASVLRYTGEWKNTVEKMGRWVDFENDYKTMDLEFMESVWWVFKQCFDKGLIYQGYKIQPYSPALATPLSNFETNQGYKDRQDPSLTVSLPFLDDESNLLIWTTTPWTLPSNLAVAMGPEIDYVLIEIEGTKYWLAQSRVSAYFKDDVEILDSKKGREFQGKKYQPLFNYVPEQSKNQYSILLADFVSTEDGTGAVHIAPSFGEDDFILGKVYDLGLFDPLDEEGKFTSTVKDWEGLGTKESDKSIIRHLKEKGRVFKQETLVHSYPHCYRTDVPLIYRAIKTWFLGLEKELTNEKGETKTLKDWMIHCNQQINWVPNHIKDGRFGKWLEGARDWNLARNRFWGTPIPVWQTEDGDSLCVGSIKELEGHCSQKITDLHKHNMDKLILSKDGKEYKRTPEVLDCWFESGSMPYAQNHYPFENKEKLEAGFPADFIAEGLDQTRGWFYTLTVLGAALFQKPAFKNVVINGIILAEDGQKMSKRLKNYPDPNDLIDKTSADAIRLFMINSAAVKAGDLKFSETGVNEMVRAILLPLWNSLSLFVTYANADASKGQLTWKPGDNLKSVNELDQWILSDLQVLLDQVQIEMDGYKLFNVVPAIVDFIDDLTNWYIRRSRRRFWKSENDEDKNFAYATLYQVLVEFSKVLAPFLPFLAEEIYQILVRETNEFSPKSVHLCDFPTADDSLKNEPLVMKMNLAREAVNLGRTLRAQHNLKNRQPLASLGVVVRSDQEETGLRTLISLIQEELNVKKVIISQDETGWVKFSAKANFKVLGKKMGKFMKEVASKIATLSHEQVTELLSGGTINLEQGPITQEDILVQREVLQDVIVEASPLLTIALDPVITDELAQEGVARECVNKIQNYRKEMDLAVTDKIVIRANADSEWLKNSLNLHKDYIMNETQAKSITWEEALESKCIVEYKGENVSFQVQKID